MPREVANRCAATMPNTSHSIAVAKPVDHLKHFAATSSNIASRLASKSCFESRTPPSVTAGSSEKITSSPSIAIPMTSGPAQLPLPTSSIPTIVSNPFSRNARSRDASGHGLTFFIFKYSHQRRRTLALAAVNSPTCHHILSCKSFFAASGVTAASNPPLVCGSIHNATPASSSKFLSSTKK